MVRAVNPLLVRQTIRGTLSNSAAAQTATAMASSVRAVTWGWFSWATEACQTDA